MNAIAAAHEEQLADEVRSVKAAADTGGAHLRRWQQRALEREIATETDVDATVRELNRRAIARMQAAQSAAATAADARLQLLVDGYADTVRRLRPAAELSPENLWPQSVRLVNDLSELAASLDLRLRVLETRQSATEAFVPAVMVPCAQLRARVDDLIELDAVATNQAEHAGVEADAVTPELRELRSQIDEHPDDVMSLAAAKELHSACARLQDRIHEVNTARRHRHVLGDSNAGVVDLSRAISRLEDVGRHLLVGLSEIAPEHAAALTGERDALLDRGQRLWLASSARSQGDPERDLDTQSLAAEFERDSLAFRERVRSAAGNAIDDMRAQMRDLVIDTRLLADDREDSDVLAVLLDIQATMDECSGRSMHAAAQVWDCLLRARRVAQPE